MRISNLILIAAAITSFSSYACTTLQSGKYSCESINQDNESIQFEYVVTNSQTRNQQQMYSFALLVPNSTPAQYIIGLEEEGYENAEIAQCENNKIKTDTDVQYEDVIESSITEIVINGSGKKFTETKIEFETNETTGEESELEITTITCIKK